MSLQGRLSDLVQRLATEFKELRTDIGHSGKLAPFHLALAGQSSSPCNIFVVGDSVGEGAVTTDPINKRWQKVFERSLRDAPGGEGYLPAWFASPFVTNPANFSHTPVNASGAPSLAPVVFEEASTSQGFASRRLGLRKSGWVEWTFTGDQVRLWYDKTSWFGLNARVYIDGVDMGVVSGQLGSGEEGAANWLSPKLQQETHTIRVQEADNLEGAFWLEGVQFLGNDANSGVHVYDGSHSGGSAAYFSNSSTPWPDSMSRVSPSLVLIMLGFNDQSSRTPAQFQSDLTALVNRIKAKLVDGTYALAIVAPWSPAPAPSAGWDAYINAIKTVANSHPNGFVIRIDKRWPKMVANQNNPGMFAQDTIHPSEAGQIMLGSYIADALNLPTKPSVSGIMPVKEISDVFTGPGPNWFIEKGEWAIPAGATSIEIDICAPGNGGGSGRRGAPGTVRCGGGGGASGALTRKVIPVRELPDGTTKLYYHIPPPGAGADAVTTDNTDGNNGQPVGMPTYVSLVQDSYSAANLVASAWYTSNGGGKGGMASSGGGGSGTAGTFNGATGGSASTTGGVGGNGFSSANGDVGGGGGAGGGLTSSNTASNGGSGGYSTSAYPTTTGGTAGVATGTRTGGTPSSMSLYIAAGGGGGGGASNASAAGASGGHGANYGGGGGGGAASPNGYVSGKGGDGGRGYIRLTARF